MSLKWKKARHSLAFPYTDITVPGWVSPAVPGLIIHKHYLPHGDDVIVLAYWDVSHIKSGKRILGEFNLFQAKLFVELIRDVLPWDSDIIESEIPRERQLKIRDIVFAAKREVLQGKD